MEHFERLFKLYQEIEALLDYPSSLTIERDGSGCIEFWHDILGEEPEESQRDVLWSDTNFLGFDDGVEVFTKYLEELRNKMVDNTHDNN